MGEVTRSAIRETFGSLVALEETQVSSGAAVIAHGGVLPLSVAAFIPDGRVLVATLRPVYEEDDALKASSQLGLLLRAHRVTAFSATWESNDITAMTAQAPEVRPGDVVTWLVTESTTAVSLWDHSGRCRASHLDPTDVPTAAVALMMGWAQPTAADADLVRNPEAIAAGMKRAGFEVSVSSDRA